MTTTTVNVGGQNLFSGIWDQIVGINEIMSFLGIGGVFGLISGLFFLIKKRQYVFELFYRTSVYVKNKGYYTDAFLLENIEKAKERIIIFCVRNLRISESDIMQAFKMACDRGVNVQLYWMSTEISECIIEEIMVTLPIPASTVLDYKNQVGEHTHLMENEIRRWGNSSQGKIGLYTYKALPTMHFCCFDNKIYIGFQIYNPNDDIESVDKLGDYCIVIKAKSRLGKLILKQVELLGSEKIERIN